MKKQESIDINILEQYKETKTGKIDFSKINVEKLYFENSKEEICFKPLDRSLSSDEQMALIDQEVANFNQSYADLMHKYYFLKLFSKAAKKSDAYNQEWFNIDHYTNDLKRAYDEIKRTNNAYKRRDDLTDTEIFALYYKICDLHNFYNGLMQDMKTLQDKFYPLLKISSYGLCSEKKYTELEKLYQNVSEELKKYKNLEDAYDYICFNSGTLITDLVGMFVELPRKTKIDISYHYFLATDAIICFKFAEWVELYSKFMYMKKKLGSRTLYTKKFRDLFDLFEIRYTIVLLYNEYSNSKRDK